MGKNVNRYNTSSISKMFQNINYSVRTEKGAQR